MNKGDKIVKKPKRKIRLNTWYWGNWVYEGEHGFKLSEKGFELYDEEKHGWHHSEEYKNGQKEKY